MKMEIQTMLQLVRDVAPNLRMDDIDSVSARGILKLINSDGN